jgi:hypothetical protein
VRLFLAFGGGNAVQSCIERTLSSERKADKVKLFDRFRSAICVKRAGCLREEPRIWRRGHLLGPLGGALEMAGAYRENAGL